MGREAVLFKIEIENSIKFAELNDKLLKLGFVKCDENAFINYENVSKEGILEAEVMVDEDVVNGLYVRFSLGNPFSIIDKVIQFFKDLKETLPCKIIFVNLWGERQYINKENIQILKERLIEQKKDFDICFIKIDFPIRGGKETYDYVRAHKNENELN